MVKYLFVIFTFFMCSVLTGAEVGSQTPTLYYSTSCGHCKQVIKYLNKNNINVRMRNIGSSDVRSEFNRLGVRGVPVLVVNGRKISGSSSIISYFESR